MSTTDRESVASRERHPLESMGRGVIITLVGQLVLIAATFVSRLILVQHLSTTDYGDIAIGLSIVSIVSPFASLGIPYGVTRQLAHAKSPREKYELALSSVRLMVPLSVAAGVAIYLGAPAMSGYLRNPNMVTVLDYLAAYLTVTMLANIIGAVFQGEENMVPSALFSMIVSPVLLLAFLVTAFRTGASLSGAMAAYLLSSLAALVGLTLYAYRRRARLLSTRRLGDVGSLGDRPNPAMTRNLFLFSVSLTMLGVASIVTGNVDTLFLGFYTRSPSVAGAYSLMITMSRLQLLAVGSLSYIALPVASRMHRSGNMQDLAKSYAAMIKWTLAVSFPLYALFLVFPVPLIDLVAGNSSGPGGYASYALVLQIAATATVATCLLGPSQSVLTGFGRIRLLLYDTFASAAVDVFGSLLFVPIWGIYGAVLAFGLSTVTLPLLAVIQTRMEASVHPFRREVLTPLFAFWGAAGVVLGVPTMLWHWAPSEVWFLSLVELAGLYLLLLGIYLGLIFVTRSLAPEDSHLLAVVEDLIGQPLPRLRAFARRIGGGLPGERAEPVPPKMPADPSDGKQDRDQTKGL